MFDDPMRYQRPKTMAHMVRETIDPSENARRVPQVPLYTDMYPQSQVRASAIAHRQVDANQIFDRSLDYFV